MSGVARDVSTPRSTSQRQGGKLDSAGNTFSQKIRGKEDELLKQKITFRLNELEKDGTEIIKDIGKLRTQVEVMLEDARFIVDDFESIENPRKGYQDVSQRLVEVEDGMAMLAACIAQWQGSSSASSEFNETSNNGDSSQYLVTEPVQDPDGPIELEQDGRDGDHNFLDGSAILSEGRLEEKEIKTLDNVLTEKPRQEVLMNKIREIGTNVGTKDQKRITEFKKPCSNSSENGSQTAIKSRPHSTSLFSPMEKPPSSVMKASTSSPLPLLNFHNESSVVADNTNVRGPANLSVNNPNQEKLEHGLISQSDNEKSAPQDYSNAGNLKSVVRSTLNKPRLSTDKSDVKQGPLQGPQFHPRSRSMPTSRPAMQQRIQVVKQGPQKQLMTRSITTKKVNVQQEPNLKIDSRTKPSEHMQYLMNPVSNNHIQTNENSFVDSTKNAANESERSVFAVKKQLSDLENPNCIDGAHSSDEKISNCDRTKQDLEVLGPQNTRLIEKNTSNLDSSGGKSSDYLSDVGRRLCGLALTGFSEKNTNDESEYMFIKDLPIVQKPIFDEQKIKEETIHFNKELEKVRLAREKMLVLLDSSQEHGASLDHLENIPLPKTVLDLIEESNSERLKRIAIENLGKELCSLEAGHVGLFTFVEGCPSMFWIYKEGKGLSKLQDYLETRYGQGEGDGGGDELTSGSPVLAKYSLDGRYFRARVEEVVVRDDNAADCMYSVCYMDYGNSEVVSGRELISWDTRLDAVPEQAMSCCLADGPDQWREDGWGSWTGEQLHVFHQTIKEGELIVELHTDIRKKNDPTKPMFTAFVWVNGISVVEILKKHPLFSQNLAHCEPKKCSHQKNSFSSRLRPIDKTVRNQNGTHSLAKPVDHLQGLQPNKHVPASLVDKALVRNANVKVYDWLINKCDDGSVSQLSSSSAQGLHPSKQPRPYSVEIKSPVVVSSQLPSSPALNCNQSRLHRAETKSPVASIPQLPSPSVHQSNPASNQSRPHCSGTKFNVVDQSHLPWSSVDRRNPASYQSKPHCFQTDPISSLSHLPSSPSHSFIPISTLIHKHHHSNHLRPHRSETNSPVTSISPSLVHEGNHASHQSRPHRSETKSIATSISQLPSDSAHRINRASKHAKPHHSMPPVTAIHNVGTLQILVDENACFNLTMSTIDNPGQFFVRPVQDETKRLDDISKEIQGHPLTTPEERLAVPGTVWAIMDGARKWFRVRIEKCDFSGVSIRYIDYGGTRHNVAVGCLRQLPATWVSDLPGLAVPCHLAGCQPKGGKWDNIATALLEELVGYEREHKAILVGEEAEAVGVLARSMGVVLLAEDVVINRKMVEWGFAESQFMDYGQIDDILMNSDKNKLQENWNPMKDDFLGSLENNDETNQEDIEMATTGYTSKDVVCPNFELRGECFRGQFCELRHVYTTRPAVTDDREEIAVETFSKLSLPCPGRTVYVEISEVTSPSLFYCVLALGNSDIKHVSKQDVEERVNRSRAAGQDTLASFMNHMQIFYRGKTRTDFTAIPALGELVACKNPFNNLWCRGRVTANREAEVKDYYENNEEEGKTVVFFVDFGQTELVELSQMRRLETRFTTFPLQAVECCLAGVMPMETSWSDRAIQEFTKMVQNQWLMAQVVSCADSRIFIDLLIPGDPGNDIIVAEELKKMGLARMDKFLSPNIPGDHIIKMPG